MVGLLHILHGLKMPQVLTVSCKLEVTPSQVEKLDAVLRTFASCCEYVNNSTDPKLTNQIAVQSLIYKEARDYSGLSAQMTIHAIRRVCANRKTAKQKDRPVQGFAPTSATYDARTFTFREKDWTPHSALKVSHPDNFEVKQAVVPEASGGWKGRGDDAIDCQPVPTAFVL